MILDNSRTKLAEYFSANGAPDADILWVPCADARHGDYQCNAAMPLAKKLSRNPRDLATAVAAAWNAEHTAAWGPLEVAGPGFLNWRMSDAALIEAHTARVRSTHTISQLPANAHRTYVLDYSGPNVAKAMHVGHIRSTILGDTLARALRSRGHTVITDNHIGDWGTQFGKLIYGWKNFGDSTAFDTDPIAEMERLYKTAHELSGQDPAVLEKCRNELLLLQQGDPENRALWQLFRARSQAAFDHIYQLLDIRFDHSLGESFYQDRLAPVVQQLKQLGIAKDSEGAICVFFPDHAELADKPFLIEKSDGAALYATTDLATLQYRIEKFHPHEIWYVTDMRQSLHFAQLFETARLWGIPAQLRHVGFGAILGQDRRPLKTREGNPIKLESLLDEATARARALMETRGQSREHDSEIDPELTARALGIGSVKYADLSQNRHLDYIFDWDKMLAFDGNTAPYLINAHVRACSILRKAQDHGDPTAEADAGIEPAERELLIHFTRWEAVIDQVIAEQRPHHLCFYLFALAGSFHRFFENCPVLKSEGPLRSRRLATCHTTARILADGLRILGITPLERM